VTLPLNGWRVLVPRGGPWGDDVSARLRAQGAEPLIAPLIDFIGPEHPAAVTDAMQRLEAAEFDWLVVTSATTVEAIGTPRPPATVRVASVGDATTRALEEAGFRVDFQPIADASARALVDEWPADGARVLVPQSALADATLVDGLRARGCHITAVTAYRTVPVTADAAVVEAVRAGEVRAMLVTSGSVARQVAEQFGAIPPGTIIACIGPRTAEDARAVGLRVDVVARRRSVDDMIRSLIDGSDSPNSPDSPNTEETP